MTVQIMKIVILKEVKIMSKKIISQKDAKEIARKNNLANVIIVKKDGTREPFDGNKIIIAVGKSASRIRHFFKKYFAKYSIFCFFYPLMSVLFKHLVKFFLLHITQRLFNEDYPLS